MTSKVQEYFDGLDDEAMTELVAAVWTMYTGKLTPRYKEYMAAIGVTATIVEAMILGLPVALECVKRGIQYAPTIESEE